jgi:hypothetical protein
MSAFEIAQRSRHWFGDLPRAVQAGLWLLLVVVFAGPSFLLLFAPVAAGLWLWEARRRKLDLWQWSRHLFAMVVAMYVGMFMYHHLVQAALIWLGFGAAFEGDLGYAWMMASMVVGMVALMRYEGHTWSMANEMSVGMVAPVVACFALVRLGICPLVPFLSWLTEANVYGVAHTAMLLGMLAVMVWRRRMYGPHVNAPAVHRHRSLAAIPEGAR